MLKYHTQKRVLGLARDCHSERFPRIWAVLHRRFPSEHSSLAQVRCVCHSATPAWRSDYLIYDRAGLLGRHVCFLVRLGLQQMP